MKANNKACENRANSYHKAIVGGAAGPAMARPLFLPKKVLAGPYFWPNTFLAGPFSHVSSRLFFDDQRLIIK